MTFDDNGQARVATAHEGIRLMLEEKPDWAQVTLDREGIVVLVAEYDKLLIQLNQALGEPA